MLDPFKEITKLKRENTQKDDLIEQLNERLKQINIRLQKLEKKLPELVKAENEMYISQIVEKTEICAKVIDAASEAVKQTIVEAIK